MSDAAFEHAYPKPGDLVDAKYEIHRELGSGGMGAVLEATHLLRKARVALKFMSPRIVHIPGLVERFLNEGVVASRINNEHVVAVLDVSRLPSGLPYMVMEYLEGEDLRQLLEREGAPGLGDVQRAVHFVLQVLRGLQAAHQVGIVHRDLKPANCFVLERDGEPDFIKLVDFGISKVSEGDNLNLTQAGAALGTPLYVSPEQARNPKNVDARTDLYSVAVLVYELLAGRAPFATESGSLVELFLRLANTEPPPLDQLAPHVPAALVSVVSRGLAKAADDRFQSCAEFALELAPFADTRSELVLKQLLQRPSAGPVRLTPAPPRLSSGLPSPLAATATAGAVPARVSSPASLARGPLPVPHPPASAAPRQRSSALWGMAGALLLAVAAAWAFTRSQLATAPAEGRVINGAEAASATLEPAGPHPAPRAPGAAAAVSTSGALLPSGLGPALPAAPEPVGSIPEPTVRPLGASLPEVPPGVAAAAPGPAGPDPTLPARPQRKAPTLKHIRIED